MRTLSAAARLLPYGSAGEAARVPRRHLLGPARARIRRSRRTPADPRARACRPRRESYGSRVHRRWRRRLGRLSDAGASSPWLRQHPDVAAHTRRTDADGRIHHRRRAMRAARQQASPRRDRALSRSPRVRSRGARSRASGGGAWEDRIRCVAAAASTSRGHRVAPTAVRSWRRRTKGPRTGGTADPDRQLSSEPSEYEHGETDARHDGGRLQESKRSDSLVRERAGLELEPLLRVAVAIHAMALLAGAQRVAGGHLRGHRVALRGSRRGVGKAHTRRRRQLHGIVLLLRRPGLLDVTE